MLTFLRNFIGKIIILSDKLTQPKSLERSPERQRQVDLETSQFILYHFQACPFCIKVRRVIKRLGLKIEMRDAQNNPQYKEELIKGGGEYQTPCLRITKSDGSVQWMYESSDIVKFLEEPYRN